MRNWTGAHPALALFGLAVLLGMALLAPVLAGVAPPALAQLAALSASAAGFILAAFEGGPAAVRELLGRALIWRVGPRWWLVALLLPLLPILAAVFLSAALGGQVPRPASPLHGFIPALLFQIIFAGVGEEFGWRGFALPRLQRRHTALAASLIVGVLHAAWHLPLFLIPDGPFSAFAGLGLAQAFFGYATLVVALSVLLTWAFNNARGSVLIAATLHGAFNAWNGFFGMESVGTSLLFGYVGLILLLAAIVTVAFGHKHLARRERSVLGTVSR